MGGGITFLGLIAPHIEVGARCKTTATDCNLRFLIAAICRYFRRSHHGPNGIASGDYRFDFRSAVFYLLALEKHLEYMEMYIKVSEKKPIFQDVNEKGFFAFTGFQRISMRAVRVESGIGE
ncbi:hypothetical protein [Peribacillus simplex]|uniref:hypothetical protein n=1 Tax=Peribacillus simplex TaxID=1478 RepID=UPI003D9C4DD3